MAEEKSGGKNAIPPCGRKRIFAEFGVTLFLKHCLVGLCYVFEKRLQGSIILAIMVTVANIHDNKAVGFFMRTLAYFLNPVKIIIADGVYRGEIIKQVKSKCGYFIDVVMRND